VKVSVPIAEVHEFAQILIHYLTAIEYQGLVGIEFKRDPRDGEFKVLEVNARSMGGNIFPFTCGLNLVYAAYLDTLGQPVTLPQSYTTGLVGISLVTDLAALMGRARARTLSIQDLIPYFRRKKWSKFSTDDPVPFFVDIWQRLLSPSMLHRALFPS
jgi:predicted ATP-grasp superfamily ATP-dependent carboligase